MKVEAQVMLIRQVEGGLLLVLLGQIPQASIYRKAD